MQPRPWADTVSEPSVRVCMVAILLGTRRRGVTAPALARSPRHSVPPHGRPPRRVMNRSRRLLGAGSLAVLAAALLPSPAHAAPAAGALARVQGFLADQLGSLAAGVPTTVLVHGTDLASAR